MFARLRKPQGRGAAALFVGSLFLMSVITASGQAPNSDAPRTPARQSQTPPANQGPAPNANAPAANDDSPISNFNQPQTTDAGDLDTLDVGQIDTPNFGDLENPDFSDLETPDFSDLENPDFSDLESPDFSDVESPEFDTPGSNVPESAVQTFDTLFVSPEEASGNLGASVPLRLDLESTVLAGTETPIGLELNTTGNRLVVANIAAGSMFAKSGLMVGDQVLAVERTWIRTFDQLNAELMTAIAGDGRAWVLVNRGGQRVWVSLDFAVGVRPILGINTIIDNGVVILSNVAPGSPAALVGLQVGDVILFANGIAITSHAQLLDAIMFSAVGDGRLELVIERASERHTVVVRIDRLNIETTAGAGTDFTAEAASEEAAEELEDEGLTFAAEIIDSVFDSTNALLAATEDVAARTDGRVHVEAEATVALAREMKDVVDEMDTDSAASVQASVGQLISTADEVDRRLTSLAIFDLADAEESMATARESIDELRESLEAISASISGGGGVPK